MTKPQTQSELHTIIDHYQVVDEDSRLRTGWFALEHARTQDLLSRHLPAAPAVIFDVGGGSGAYGVWLSSLGYEVHLIDPVPKHIDQARERSARQPHPIATMRVGDARHIEAKDNSADAVLLLGPLYHLTDRADRLRSLREALRVLRPGGWIFAAAISHFASLLDSLRYGFFSTPEFAPILERDLAEGQHRNPTDNPMFFTTAFFHRPNELTGEIEEAGFRLEKIVGIEGPGWMADNFDQLWSDAAQRKRLMDILRQVEQEPALIGTSAHLMAIARK